MAGKLRNFCGTKGIPLRLWCCYKGRICRNPWIYALCRVFQFQKNRWKSQRKEPCEESNRCCCVRPWDGEHKEYRITRQVSRTFDLNTGNTEVTLTNREFEILYLLASSPGRVFSKEQIYDLVWEEPYFGDYNIVMSHIRNIREKIGDNPSKPIYIQTVWGVGYRFNKNISSGLWVDYRSLLIFHF